MVTIRDLSKTFDTVHAVRSVSLEVASGELFGVIGPDGAGKTTLFRMLATLLLPDSGKATVAGYDIATDYKSIRGAIGYMPGRFSLYQDLTVEENLRFFATLFNTTVEENYHLVRDIYAQIEPFRKRRAGKLSGGMKQKLALSCALIHKPRVLILDEPTTGVDPVSRREFWEMLIRLKKQEITIVVSTPYMDEANMCDRVALIQAGKIMAVDTPGAIIAGYPGRLYGLRGPDMPRLLADTRAFEDTLSCYSFGESLHIEFKGDDVASAAKLRSHLERRRHTAVEIKTIAPTIEDCFMKLLR